MNKEERMSICRACPLYQDIAGGRCNPGLWIDPETDHVSNKRLDGHYKGCGCALRAKTSCNTCHCPAKKW